jgi:hypothetical protein
MHEADGVDHVAQVEGRPQAGMAHRPAGRIAHLLVLQMEGGGGKGVQRSRVVVVKVGQHHVLHGRSVDPGLRQQGCGRVDEFAAALLGGLLPETGVDHDDASMAPDHPDVIVQRHGPLVQVHARHEVLAPRTVGRGAREPERQHLVSRFHRFLLLACYPACFIIPSCCMTACHCGRTPQS